MNYFRYVVLHKWCVFYCGFSFGPKEFYKWPAWILRLVLHDWDKFTPVEWFAYKRRFDKGNDFTKMSNDPEYHMAWHMHSKRNDHHWEWWVTVLGDGKLRALPMSDFARSEMLADWYGMGKSFGDSSILPWYSKANTKMFLNPDTRRIIEDRIGFYVGA